MPTIVSQVSALNHDCQVWKNILGNWTFDLNHLEVAIGYRSGATYAQGCGLYFPDIPIPPGSTIRRAFLIFRSSALNAFNGAKSKIRVEENANPVPFSTFDDYWNRPTWDVVEPWEFLYKKWSKDELYSSPEIGKFVQRVIDLPGWAEGNPIVFFWDDHDEHSWTAAGQEREGYSYDKKPEEAPRLEITYIPPAPPPPPPPAPLPTPPPPPRKGWSGLDLQYEYLDDGFKLTLHTDVPCHLYCRMTTTPPRRHSLPSMRRGLRITGDIRFCFVVYEDNEQTEAGDTLIHTWYKSAWPVCETRWFYFIGLVYGDTSPSESPIFKFHFPAPPPEPPPPITRIYFCDPNNATIRSTWGTWPPTRNGYSLTLRPPPDDYLYRLQSGHFYTVSFFLYRSFLDFDTAGIPETAIFVSIELGIWLFPIPGWGPSQCHLIMTPGFQSDPVVIADWYPQNAMTQYLGDLLPGAMADNQYNLVPFSPAAYSFINKTGHTKLCLVNWHDFFNIPPAPIPTTYSAEFHHSYQKGDGYRPYLKVQYYPA